MTVPGLEGAAVVVTGGGSGIGAATARQLGRAGAAVALAGELAPLGVRVNGISPGPIDTPIHTTWADDLDEAYRWLSGQVPLGRIGAPEEVALWITLLLSPMASFMTGAVIPLDGGQVIDRE